ncbi:MAG: hypothetical protein Athens071424_41 [Parcubacteria group bacterium Athens0714_24]|nr:MAG: hypothetical protein Athens071424_41 [Parcubacteria group bacterium Athens0714_24]
MIIKEKISKEEFDKLFNAFYGTVLKMTVDIEKNILSAGCEFHIECSEELVEKESSEQKNLWGANLYRKDMSIDYNSLINIKPMENNRSMEIQDSAIKQRVEKIIKDLLCN